MISKKFLKRNKNLVNRFTRSFLAKNKVGVVHGTRATNAQLPRRLKRETLDWDVFVKNPELRARQLEHKLDKRFRVNVYKIISNDTGEGLVDFATPSRQVESVAKRGVRFATLRDQKMAAMRNVSKPELKFRREKDQNLLNRIKKFEKIRGRKI